MLCTHLDVYKQNKIGRSEHTYYTSMLLMCRRTKSALARSTSMLKTKLKNIFMSREVEQAWNGVCSDFVSCVVLTFTTGEFSRLEPKACERKRR